MRITGCHIEAFGQFEKYTLDTLDHPLVVVLGPNEAGKSTVFQFMVTMLYGFSPADAQRHPYRPVSGQSLGGSMEFRSGSTRCSVERRLGSTPKGVLSIGSEGLFGNKETIRNRPLGMTGDVSREVFEAIYALSLRDMAQVSGRAWNSIQDRLLGGLNLDTLRLAREAVEELELEARKLWRPDRRGKTRAQDLAEQLRTLRRQVRDARERDETVRDLNREIESLRGRMEEDERMARELRRVKGRAERLLPVKARLDRIAHLEDVAGDRAELECIPTDPRAELERLEAELQQIDAVVLEMEDAVKSREEIISSVTELDERLESVASEIRSWHARAALFTQRRMQIEESEGKLERLVAHRNQLGESLVSGDWTADAERAVREVRAGDLREAVRRYWRCREELDIARARREGLGLRDPGTSSLVGRVMLIAGLVLGIVGGVLGEPALWGPAIAIAAVGAGFVFQTLADKGDIGRGSVSSDAEEESLQKAHQVVLDLLGDVPLSAFRREEPHPELAGEIHALQAVLGEVDAERASADTLRTKLASDEKEVERLMQMVGLGGSDVPEAELGRVFEMLADAESRRAAAEEAARTLPKDRERLRDLKQRGDRLRRKRADLMTRLSGLGGGDSVRGVDTAVERMRAAERAAATREELEASVPDLESVIEELARPDGEMPTSPEALAELEERLEQISRTLRDGYARIASHETRIRSLLEQKTVAEIESEAAVVLEEQGRIRTERDRFLLLANVIRHADARFRDRHQPDVIRRASDITSRLTGGRYGHIEVDEEEGALSIREEDTGRRFDVGEPLSRGTLDQIYLALRLGLADHLDASGERLPLFLDEVLVNWDATRRRAACGLLADLSASRQIIFFTCHPWLAHEVEQRADARVVKL